MKDKDKTRKQLTEELEELRRRVADLQAIEAKHLAVERILQQTEQEKQTILDSLVEHVIFHDMEMRYKSWLIHSSTRRQFPHGIYQALISPGLWAFPILHQQPYGLSMPLLSAC